MEETRRSHSHSAYARLLSELAQLYASVHLSAIAEPHVDLIFEPSLLYTHFPLALQTYEQCYLLHPVPTARFAVSITRMWCLRIPTPGVSPSSYAGWKSPASVRFQRHWQRHFERRNFTRLSPYLGGG